MLISTKDDNWISLQQSPPPTNTKVFLRLFDHWAGEGREVEIITAFYDGKIFTHATNGQQAHERFITGWKLF